MTEAIAEAHTTLRHAQEEPVPHQPPGMPAAPNFNHLARIYRWLEYLTFGPFLWRCRVHFLPQLSDCRSALVLGDGDGRFTARLLRENPHLRVMAIDGSPGMIDVPQEIFSAITRPASQPKPPTFAHLETGGVARDAT